MKALRSLDRPVSGDVWRKPCLLSHPIERSPTLSNPEISVATATQRAYQREFGVRNPPKRNTILGLVNKLETTGSLVSEKGKHRSSRLPTVVVDNKTVSSKFTIRLPWLVLLAHCSSSLHIELRSSQLRHTRLVDTVTVTDSLTQVHSTSNSGSPDAVGSFPDRQLATHGGGCLGDEGVAFSKPGYTENFGVVLGMRLASGARPSKLRAKLAIAGIWCVAGALAAPMAAALRVTEIEDDPDPTREGPRTTSRLLASRPHAEAEVDDHPTRMKLAMATQTTLVQLTSYKFI
ncbi:hypothetical protein ANN_21658 [Periplaneta americana]|uniref:DUF4817 domain-containing protein n=1 Tax=Periplaneta americana TaxID=6978 RepID=A0ABQ8S625_PERAM|nr:hypothetical protein ANN_21658 [Periplaneta americana]